MNAKHLDQLVSLMNYGSSQKKSETVNTPQELDISYTSQRPEWKPNKNRPTPEQVAKLLRVDDNGVLWWLQPKQGRKLNKPAGFLIDGYLNVRINGVTYGAHRLAFVLYNKRWQELGKVINHLNGNRSDNRRCNLQEATLAENSRHQVTIPSNNTSGAIGVSRSRNKWRATLRYNGKLICGGTYSDFNEAVAARDRLAIAYGHNRQSNFLNISNETKV